MTSLATVKPPTPESKIPIGISAELIDIRLSCYYALFLTIKTMDIKDKTSQTLYQIITFLEFIIAVLLVIFIILGTSYLVVLLINQLKAHFFLTPKELHRLLDVTLTLFIIIELFRTVLAYIASKKILRIVFEAAFVAVARKIVLFDVKDYATTTQALMAALAIGFVLISLAIGYYAVSQGKKQKELLD